MLWLELQYLRVTRFLLHKKLAFMAFKLAFDMRKLTPEERQYIWDMAETRHRWKQAKEEEIARARI